MINYTHLRICKELIRTDLLIFRKELVSKCIDLLIWVVLNLMVTGYILPYFGLSKNFGLFQLGGVIAAAALFEMYSNVASLVSDFSYSRVIYYNLTLPLPSWLAVASKMIYYGIIYFFIAACMLPAGKLCLWNQVDLTLVNYTKLCIALLAQGVFYACFILLPVSLIANPSQMRSVWARFIFPMWITGGFQFSWFALHAVLPHMAYAVLFNPLIYITESLRIALMGQTGFLNFWLCIALILLYSLIFLYLAMKKLKKRLDYV